MMRVLKALGWILFGSALLAGVAVAIVGFGGAPLIVQLIEKQGSAALGRQIRVERVDVSWGRPIRILAERISVATADWSSDPNILTIGRLDFSVDPAALLRLELIVPQVAVEEPMLLLETATEGAGNWESLIAAAGGSKHHLVPRVQRLLIRAGSFRFRNGQTGTDTEMALENFVAETPDVVSPVKISAEGVFQQEPFAVAGELAALDQLRAASQPYHVKLDGSLGTNNVTLAGTIAEPLGQQGLDLRVEMKGQNLQQLLTTLGIPVPEMPIYHLAGHLQRQRQQWHVEEVTGRVGNSFLAGEILVDAGQQVPYIRADLTSTYLDLSDLRWLYGDNPNSQSKPPAKKDQTQALAGKSTRVIPDFRLPAEKLLGFNGDFLLDAGNVRRTAGLPFEHATLGVSLKDGTLRLKPLRIAIGRGELLADFEYRSTEGPQRFRADVDLRHIDLARLLASADVQRSVRQTAGVVGGFVKLRSAGTEPRQILSELNGDLGLFVQGGKLDPELVGEFESSFGEALGLPGSDKQPHVINCFIGRIKVDKGVATAQTVVLDTAEAIIVARGNINIADETLFLNVKPYPKSGSPRRVGVPIKIRGTLDKPNATADRVGVVDRLGAAIGLGDDAPPASLLPLIEAGLGEKSTCGKAFSAGTSVGQGSSTPPPAK